MVTRSNAMRRTVLIESCCGDQTQSMHDDHQRLHRAAGRRDPSFELSSYALSPFGESARNDWAQPRNQKDYNRRESFNGKNTIKNYLNMTQF